MDCVPENTEKATVSVLDEEHKEQHPDSVTVLPLITQQKGLGLSG